MHVRMILSITHTAEEKQGGTHIGYSPTGFPLFLPTKLKILLDYRLVILAA